MLFDSLLKGALDEQLFDKLWTLLTENLHGLRSRILSPLIALDLLQQAEITDASLTGQIRVALCGDDREGPNPYEADQLSLSRKLFDQDDFTVVNEGNNVSFSTFVDEVRHGEILMVNHGLLELFAKELENRIHLLS